MRSSSIKYFYSLFLFLLCFYGHSAMAAPEKKVRPDSSAVTLRTLPATKKQALDEDSDYRYDRIPPQPKSLMERFFEWLRSLFSKAEKSKGGEFSMQAVQYVLIAVAIAAIVLLILKNNVRGLFRGTSAPIPIAFSEAEENIHEANFDALIAEAEARRDFRKAVRMHFLKLLKQLSDKGLISWQIGKTNSDYTIELSKTSYRQQFAELAYLYEYIWYGDFNVTETGYSSLISKFKSFKTA